MNDLLTRLAEPFPPESITWKPGATKGDKCMALAYADLRAYMERLDEVCGSNWSAGYEPWGQDRLICRLTISGVTRSSTGEMSASEAKGDNGGTVAEAQAFKRACAMFGLGRSLYDLPSPWVEFDPQTKRITDKGKTELDNRYKAWYAKAMAAHAKQATQDAPKTSQAAQDNAKGDSGHESPPHQRMWGIGKSVFGDDWNDARPWLIAKWSAKVTPDNTRSSAGDLSDDEKTLLGDYMSEHVATLQRVWRNHKAALAQSAQPVAQGA